MSQHPSRSRASASGHPAPPHAASVLVVDDEPGMRNFLGKALASRLPVPTMLPPPPCSLMRRRLWLV